MFHGVLNEQLPGVDFPNELIVSIFEIKLVLRVLFWYVRGTLLFLIVQLIEQIRIEALVVELSLLIQQRVVGHLLPSVQLLV